MRKIIILIINNKKYNFYLITNELLQLKINHNIIKINKYPIWGGGVSKWMALTLLKWPLPLDKQKNKQTGLLFEVEGEFSKLLALSWWQRFQSMSRHSQTTKQSQWTFNLGEILSESLNDAELAFWLQRTTLSCHGHRNVNILCQDKISYRDKLTCE